MSLLFDRLNADPFLRPTFSIRERLRRLAWVVVQSTAFRWSPIFFHSWRSILLRLFGARIGSSCFFYPRATIWAPWLLVAEDLVTVANGVEIYNPGGATLKHHSILSQGSFLCGATHDINDKNFPMIWDTIVLEPYSWICARAIVLPGVTVGYGAVLGAAAVAAKSLDPLGVYIGNPARKIRERNVDSVHLRVVSINNRLCM